MNLNPSKAEIDEINRNPRKMKAFLAACQKEQEKQKAALLDDRDLQGFFVSSQSKQHSGRLYRILSRHKTTPNEYWSLVRHTWTMSEVIVSRYLVWAMVLDARRTTRHLMMTPKERARLAALPDPVKIYRGCGSPEHIGFSWTLSKKTAEKFAVIACNDRRRMMTPDLVGTAPTVIKATVAKRNIVALINDRKEQEIIAFPNRVKLLK